LSSSVEPARLAAGDPTHAARRHERFEGVLVGTAAAATSLAAALVATWPLALHPASEAPLGTGQASTVPVFSLWNLWWTADRLPHAFSGFLDAPFFYPNTGVTAYSEPMPLVGALVAPLWWLGVQPALIYNVALVLLLTLNGVFAYRLTRALGCQRAIALLGAVLAVTAPIAAKLLGVLPALGLFGIYWCLDGLVRFGRTGSARWALWAAAGYVALFYTFQQYALFFAPFAVAAGLVALSEQRWRRAAAPWLVVAALASTLAVLPLALASSPVHADLGRRPEWVVRALSADPGDFLTRSANALLHVPRIDPADTAGLFPGLIVAALALLAIGTLRSRQEHTRWVAFVAACTVLAGLLALGLNLNIAGWRPWTTLRELVPGYEEVRSAYRFAALFQAFLVVLATIGLAQLRTLARGWKAGIVAALALLAAVENLSVPQPLFEVPSSPRTEWTAWLRAQPGARVVAHVPFPGGLNVSDYEIEAWRLYAQIDHRRPLVNGYSGYFPVARAPDGTIVQAYNRFQLAMAREFPEYQLLCVLTQSLGANTVVVDRAWLLRHPQERDAFPRFLHRVFENGEVLIYDLRVPKGACRQD
jgi:hypothetical protein